MYSVPEAEMALTVSHNVETIWIFEPLLVPIRRGVEQDYASVLRNRLPTYHRVLRGDARKPLCRRVVAKSLLDGGRCEGGISQQRLALRRTFSKP